MAMSIIYDKMPILAFTLMRWPLAATRTTPSVETT